MAVVRNCILRSVHNSLDAIILPHDEEVIVGRGPKTRITDRKCSRNQVSLRADSDAQEVRVKQLGHNTTGVNGLALTRNETQVLRHGDRLEVLLGQYIYKVEFELPPSIEEIVTEENEKKRKLDEDSTVKKKVCCELFKKDAVAEVTVHTREGEWETIDNGKLLIYTAKQVVAQSKIAAYDLDGTIITTQSGHVFPKDCNDWKIAFREVPGKLKQMHNDGYKIVFMTNQAGISRGSVNVEDIKAKVVRIVNKLGVPVQTFISTGKGIYRKPAPGMWNALVGRKNGGIPVDMAASFYCGDAAAREANWAPKKKKDFSSSDRLMALNLGLKFCTPEEHFLQQRPAPFKLPEFNPSTLDSNIPLCEPPDTKLISDVKEVVVLVGYPGSGKTFFASTYLVPEGYHHINRDTLGSWQKCISTLEAALTAGKSVVIDNTSPDRLSRQRYISAAHKHGVSCRCFILKTSMGHAKHNNKFREYTDDSHEPISDMVINMYKKKYEEPSQDEGFIAVVKINSIPKFNDPALDKLYKMYLLEK